MLYSLVHTVFHDLDARDQRTKVRNFTLFQLYFLSDLLIDGFNVLVLKPLLVLKVTVFAYPYVEDFVYLLIVILAVHLHTLLHA